MDYHSVHQISNSPKLSAAIINGVKHSSEFSDEGCYKAAKQYKFCYSLTPLGNVI